LELSLSGTENGSSSAKSSKLAVWREPCYFSPATFIQGLIHTWVQLSAAPKDSRLKSI
jgi:hypothetical protein